MLETLDYTIRIGSTPTFLYFDMIQTIDYHQQSDHRKQPYCLFTLLFLTFKCAQKREQTFLSLFVYV